MSVLRFLLNGKLRVESGVAPSMTVLDWLRNVARLTGTKEGCAEGDCGTCTIVLGRPRNGSLRYEAVNSCLMMVPQLDGAAVLTVEGLAAGGALHPVQQAMVDADATQCGFCTPGFVMSMFAFRHTGEPVNDANIHDALAGNLCRCTGYRAIADACRRVVGTPADGFASAADATAHQLRQLAPCTDYRARDQIFLAPRTLGELLEAAEQYPQALLLGGGTDLGLRVSKDREVLPVVISTAGVKELQRVRKTADAIELGGAVTYSAALPYLDIHFPAFAALVRRLGSRQIRNLGTLAGNLATASPIGDTIPCLMALGAEVVLAWRSSTRMVPVASFITGYRETALTPGEVITAIRIPFVAPGQRFAAYKVCKRFDQDISTVVAAFCLTQQDGRVRELRAVYGGMATSVLRATTVEKAMAGRPWTMESLADIDAALAADLTPISDHRGGAAYRLRAAAGLLRRFQIETTLGAPARVEAL
jgi:xanthine dehydrogenase small subunit